MIILLVIINTILPIAYIFKKCISKKGIELNHVFTFSIGFWYYWVLPFVIGETKFTPVIPSWYELYNGISDRKIISYLFTILVIYICFMLAHVPKIRKNNRVIEFKYSSKVYIAWTLVVFFLFLLLAYKNSNILFKGYTMISETLKSVGVMSALLLMIFSLYGLYSLKQRSGNFRKDFLNPYFVVVCVCGIIILGLGGRLYVLTCVLSLFIIYSCFYRKIPLQKAAFVCISVLILLGAIGVLRLGTSASMNAIIEMLFLESAFTGFSLLYFIGNYRIPMVKFPAPLLSDFINIIPSVLLPNKAEYLMTLEDAGYTVYAPLGALSSFMSFQVNFGLVGTMCFIFIFVLFLRKLYAKRDNEVARFMYGMICANLMFTFFRDGFSISLVKNIFEFSLLIPIIVVCGNTFFANGKIILKQNGRLKKDGINR